ncbi:MAG: hypothetical protein HRU41_36640 [Saprospiraceae bacterium]|nr:hypothetical protein [Saprospiraceae bacterium]
MKKIRIPIIVLLLLSIGAYLLLTQWSFSPLRKLKPIEALPFDAPYGFQFLSLPPEESLPLEEDLEQSSYWMSILDKLGILSLRERQKLLVWPAGKQAFDRQLFIYDCSGIDLPKEDWEAKGAQLTYYKGHQLYQLKDQAGADIVLSTYRNLILLSHQSVFIEDALRELTDQNRAIDLKINHPSSWPCTSKESLATSYYHFPFASSLFQEATQQGLSYLRPMTWEGWCIHWQDQVNRSVFTAEVFWKEEQNLAVSKQTGLRMAAALELIPSWAMDWELLQLKDIQKTNSRLTAGRADWLSRYILPWAGDHIGWIDLMPTAEAVSLAWLVPYQDSLLAQQSLRGFLEEAGELEREIYQTFELVQVNAQNLFGAWRKGDELVQNPWWCKLANYYVFAADQQGLRQLIDAYIVGQNMLQHELPDNLIQLETQWIRGLPCPTSWRGIIPSDSKAMWLSGKDTRKGWQVEGFPASLSADLPSGPTVLWRSRLRRELDLAPSFIPLTEDRWKAAATDRSRGIYLLDQDGDILWRREFSGVRLSEIFPLVRQGASERSLLFNTNEALYQWDESGQAVDQFPIILQPEASTGVLAVDFQQEEIYEFFVPCKNGIYAFAEDGVPLPDWNPLAAAGQFLQPLQHLQTKTDDYLLGLNSAGVLHNWKRLGMDHFPPKQLSPSANPLGVESQQDPMRVAVVDDMGLAQIVNMEGAQFGLPLAVGSDSTVQFCAGNFIGDARMDFMTMREEGLRLHYYSNKGFEDGVHQRLDMRPDSIFTVSVAGRTYDLVGSLDRAKQEIRLYDGKGNLLPGFPLAGTTPFKLYPLDSRNDYVLLVGHQDWLLAYRIRL